MGIDIIPNKPVSIPDGAYTGEIVKVEKREGQYVYIDVHVTVDGHTKPNGDPLTLKDGMPESLSVKSKLGRTCMRFGLSEENLQKATDQEMPLDITNFMKEGTKVSYMVVNKVEKGGTFAKIVDDSLKPVSEPKAPAPAPAAPQAQEPSAVDQALANVQGEAGGQEGTDVPPGFNEATPEGGS